MTHDSRPRRIIRRGCVVLAAISAAWSLVALLTGGVSFDIGLFPLSSRNPRNPALTSALLIVVATVLAPTGRRRHEISGDLRWAAAATHLALARAWAGWSTFSARLERVPAVLAPIVALTIAAGVVVTSWNESQFVAAASDASGYVSQAHMWATWTLRTPEPLIAQLREFVPPEAMAPLAYRPSTDGSSIVPVTSPGLPMIMALFEMTGGRDAVFAVVPMLAALAVWATYLLGREFDGPWTGVCAAILLATSPAFLFQLTSAPMSDIPAAAFWALSLVCALRGRASWSGLAAGVAVLIRANLAPVAIVPAAIVLMGPASAFAPAELRRDKKAGHYGPPSTFARRATVDRKSGQHAIVRFAIGVVPAGLAIAALYNYWYGSPFTSGYGALGQLYSAANLLPNLTHYSQWLLESQTPVILAGVFAMVNDRRTSFTLLAFVLAIAACYVFYIPFDAWWFLRFLLPAFPALMVLTAAGIVTIARRLPREWRVATTVTALVLIVNHTIGYAAARATFDSGGEQKYAITGRYVADHLPTDAVVLSEIHSGSIRYYANRPTIRFGSIPSDHLEGAVAELRRLGYSPYLVAEDWEEDAFRTQFSGRSILAMLADGPQVELPLGHVRIYRLAR